MKLNEIYRFIVREGMHEDFRKKNEIHKKLLDAKRRYQKCKGIEKKLFDAEQLANPYADTRILYGSPTINIERLLVGIDMEVGEILLAQELAKKGKAIDLILSHHPEGRALAALDDVMGLQVDILSQKGLNYSIAKDLMEKRMKEVSRRLHAGNYARAVDAARLLNIPFMCCHTPSDNHVARYLQKTMDRKKPKNLKNVLDLLMKEPEYRDATRNNVGPRILVGKPEDKAGKIMVDMTGGTEGSKEVFARLSQAGIKTLLCMHLSDQHFEKVKNEHIHVIIAGHISSDNIGLNLLLDKLEKKERLDVIECSGFKRFKR
ncbi:MAG: NGG1p interacting factor NIF3 [Candidatus Omnitrophota bacterium]